MMMPHIIPIRDLKNTAAISQHNEKMWMLRTELLAVEEDRLAGQAGCTIDELDAYLERVIAEV